MTPLGQSPLALGADIVVRSAIKFLGGHSDVIAGVAITNDKKIADTLYLLQNGTGTALSAHDSWALAKHLKTLPARFKQSISNAERLVEFLNQREEISEVYYPGNNSSHLRQASTTRSVCLRCRKISVRSLRRLSMSRTPARRRGLRHQL